MDVNAPAPDDILLAALFAADHPLTREELGALVEIGDVPAPPPPGEVDAALARIDERLRGLPLELKKLASGYRIEVPTSYATWVSRLWVERPARYSRALLETLALIAYRQPITRPEIEAVRGVAVNTQIVRALTDRGWIRTVGHRDAPGRPALYGTTRSFLDYFGLASLEELPTLAEIRELADFEPELPLENLATAEQEEAAPEQLGEDRDGGAPAEILRGPWRADGEDGA
ncbi:MAG TPA: SMC-Scp complex subunit ScpB [Gammaproteobacteria bacterium]|nr:SMC-Scp complex subunit ScpB [Gammaproteobacteria bacterium]